MIRFSVFLFFILFAAFLSFADTTYLGTISESKTFTGQIVPDNSKKYVFHFSCSSFKTFKLTVNSRASWASPNLGTWYIIRDNKIYTNAYSFGYSRELSLSGGSYNLIIQFDVSAPTIYTINFNFGETQKQLQGLYCLNNYSFSSGQGWSGTWIAVFSDGSMENVTPNSFYLSSTQYASVSSSGVVTNNNTTFDDVYVTLNASYTYNGVKRSGSVRLYLLGITRTLSISPTSRSVGASATTGSFSVNSNASWSASSNANWLTVTNGSGSGNGTVSYRVSENSSSNSRSGSITVSSGDLSSTFSISQSGASPSLSISPTSRSVDASATTGSISVTSNVSWSTSSNASWLTVTDGSSGSGNGTVSYRVSENSSSNSRSGSITILGSGLSRTFSITQAGATASSSSSTYLVIDLSGGPDATNYPVRYTNDAPDLSSDTCRTTELWLRRIPAGTFMMGSPEDELGNGMADTYDMAEHLVTISHDFYIGVFEVTQKQWTLIMGDNPSRYTGDTRPVDSVSYNMMRGSGIDAGAGWPVHGHEVNADSFMGKLQSKTGLCMDLPTDAQWEYACRAGSTTALNSGKNLTRTDSCPNMAEVGRYSNNCNDGKGGYSQHTKVGSYLPNAWGLYDMHGNVWERCLDWFSNSYVTPIDCDPTGPNTGSKRINRGGGWNHIACYCRSANRGIDEPSYNSVSSRLYDAGFRIAYLPQKWEYTIDGEGNATITTYKGKAENVVIPTELDGHPVTAIASGAFGTNSTITSVTLPVIIKMPAENPFSGCRNLTTVNYTLDGVRTDFGQNVNVNVAGASVKEETLTLNPGWNLVALPQGELTPESRNALQSLKAIFGFDASVHAYFLATELEAGKPYWIFTKKTIVIRAK